MNSDECIQLVPEKVLSVIKATYSNEIAREALKKLQDEWKGTRVIVPNLSLRAKTGDIEGSNFYFVSELFNFYRELAGEQDILPLSQEKAEYALKINKSFFEGNYQDTGFAVRPGEGYNPILHKRLVEMVKSDFKNVDSESPFIVTGAIKPVKDDKYENDLRVEPTEFTMINNAPILLKGDGRFNSKDINYEGDGLPVYLREQGERGMFNTSTPGVCRLNRYRNLGLNARNDYLANSNDDGRVYFAKNFSSGNYSDIFEKLNELVLLEKQKIDERAVKAKRYILTGKL